MTPNVQRPSVDKLPEPGRAAGQAACGSKAGRTQADAAGAGCGTATGRTASAGGAGSHAPSQQAPLRLANRRTRHEKLPLLRGACPGREAVLPWPLQRRLHGEDQAPTGSLILSTPPERHAAQAQSSSTETTHGSPPRRDHARLWLGPDHRRLQCGGGQHRDALWRIDTLILRPPFKADFIGGRKPKISLSESTLASSMALQNR